MINVYCSRAVVDPVHGQSTSLFVKSWVGKDSQGNGDSYSDIAFGGFHSKNYLPLNSQTRKLEGPSDN